MKPETKFKLKTYLYYLLVEPWSEDFSLPNLRTLVWVLVPIVYFFELKIPLLILIIVGLILYFRHEYMSGKFVYWYRQRKYKDQKKALKEVRDKRKEQNI